MPAYELREHLQTHGYAVLGRYASPDAAKARMDALVAEDRQRQGRYTIDYVQAAQPDAPAPGVVDTTPAPGPRPARKP